MTEQTPTAKLSALLQEMEEAEQKATKGEWKLWSDDFDAEIIAEPDSTDKILGSRTTVFGVKQENDNDAELTCLLRNNAPLLIALAKAGLEAGEALDKMENFINEAKKSTIKLDICGHDDLKDLEVFRRKALSNFDSILQP